MFAPVDAGVFEFSKEDENKELILLQSTPMGSVAIVCDNELEKPSE